MSDAPKANRNYALDPLVLGKRPLFAWESRKLEVLRRRADFLRAGVNPNPYALKEASALEWVLFLLEETAEQRVISDALRDLAEEGSKRVED